MFCRTVIKPTKPWYLCGLLPFDLFSSNPDDVSDSEIVKTIKEKNMEQERGWDRLRFMFSRDEYGETSPELNSVYQATFLGVFVGCIYGGFINSKTTYQDFMERNEATAFRSHLDAKKKLQDQMTLSYAKGAFRWGWRLGLFSGSYVLFTTTISVYRGRSSLIEYVVAGGITGSLYKCSLGLRGMAVGGGLGSVLGGMAGLASLGLLKASGMTMEEIRFWQSEWRKERERKFLKRPAETNEDILLIHHEEGKGLESIPSEPVQS